MPAHVSAARRQQEGKLPRETSPGQSSHAVPPQRGRSWENPGRIAADTVLANRNGVGRFSCPPTSGIALGTCGLTLGNNNPKRAPACFRGGPRTVPVSKLMDRVNLGNVSVAFWPCLDPWGGPTAALLPLSLCDPRQACGLVRALWRSSTHGHCRRTPLRCLKG